MMNKKIVIQIDHGFFICYFTPVNGRRKGQATQVACIHIPRRNILAIFLRRLSPPFF